MSSLFFESKLPVGSSARIILDEVTKVRARLTLAFWPPERELIGLFS